MHMLLTLNESPKNITNHIEVLKIPILNLEFDIETEAREKRPLLQFNFEEMHLVSQPVRFTRNKYDT